MSTRALRAAIFAASFAVSSVLTAGIGALFHAASAQGVLRDTPQARAAIERCDVHRLRSDRRMCVRRVVAALRQPGASPADAVVFAVVR